MYVVCRVKELTKEAAQRANSGASPASQHAPHVPQSFEKTPDTVPHKTLRRPPTRPSLFHPSNIQLSSTPMKDVIATQRPADSGALGDLESLLLDAENYLPISGHHLSNSGSSSTNQIHRISPVHDLSGLTVASAVKFDVDSPEKEPFQMVEDEFEPRGSGIMKTELALSGGRRSMVKEGSKEAEVVEEMNEVVRSGRISPCSCRSLNTSIISVPPPPQPESFSSLSAVQLHGFPSATHLPSSETDSQRLFAETKARMENARTNIRHFLDTENSRTCDVSYSNQPTSLNHRDDDRLVSSQIAVSHEGSDRKLQYRSVLSTMEKMQMLPPSFMETEVVGLDRGICRPSDVVVMETASSSSCEDVSSERRNEISAMKCLKDSSGRCWAEILEQSSAGVNNNCSGGNATLPDVSWNVDSDVITPRMLDMLKAKVVELKRRQEQLERDHFLVIPHTRRTLPDQALTSVLRPGNSQSSTATQTNVSSSVFRPGKNESCSSGVSECCSEVVADGGSVKVGQISSHAQKPLPVTSTRTPDHVLTSTSRPGKSLSWLSGVSLVESDVNMRSAESPVHRRTSSAARSLMSQFIDAASRSQHQQQQPAAVITQPSTAASASQSITDSSHHLHVTSSTTACHYHHLLSDSQHPVTSASSSHQCGVKSGEITRDVCETRASEGTSLVDSGGQVVSSAHVTFDWQPAVLQTCMLDNNSIRASSVNTRSANPVVAPSPVQPYSIITSRDIVMSKGNTQNMMENPDVLSFGDVVCCNNLSAVKSQLPATNDCSDADADMLLGNHVDSAKTLNNTLKSTPAIVDVSSQLADCTSIASVTACVNGNAAMSLQQSTDDKLSAVRQSHSDVDNSVCVSSDSKALPVASDSGDMIQQLPARQLAQSV